MCGVAGIISLGRTDLGAALHTMNRAIAHRGPDDAGTWIDASGHVGLTHRRLAILDLSPAGHQPMVSADGRWILAFNGEIYDQDVHRRALIHEGHAFRGSSDTEVLLELISRHGVVEALRSVDGMFAVAAWDRSERRLQLARDRLGEKPLYYGTLGPGTFGFASELRALEEVAGRPRELPPGALAAYVRLGYIPAPLTAMEGISQLPPGCTISIDAAGVVGAATPYWSLREHAHRGPSRSFEADAAAVDAVHDVLKQSVARRMMSDVPLGAFLSGGVDSSTIVALAQAVSTVPVRTFTVSVGGEGDEADAAAAVARHLGTEHTTLPLPDLDAVAMAESMASIYDEPFADPSGIPTALLCAATREHVTVALSGDGADELFAGYNRYRVAGGPLGRALALPNPIRRGLGHAFQRVPIPMWERAAATARLRTPDIGTKAHKLGRVIAAPDPASAHRLLGMQWDPHSILTHLVSERVMPVDGAGLSGMLLTDQLGLLPDDMLVKVDRASMAVALEVRVPFLSSDLVELSWRLPDRVKVREGQRKWVVRQILGRYVPEPLWQRPKTGFDPPLATWLRGPLREWAGDLLEPGRLRRQGLLKPEPIAAALAAHQSGQHNYDYQLWTILMLQAWLERGSRQSHG